MELTLIQKTGGYVLPVSKMRLHTSLSSAGILEWETPCREIAPQNGDTVKFADVFQGYVFRTEDNGRRRRVLCYDQVKYLLYRDTKEFTGKTAADILREIIRERELSAGEIAETGVVIPSYLCENQTLFSMVQGALEETKKTSGREFVFFDQCGKLCLVDVGGMDAPTVLDGSAQMTGFSQAADIDGETYTRFKLLQEDQRSGFRRVTQAENGDAQAKWGVLQYFERVDHNWNTAQVQARIQALQQTYGSERKTLEVDAVGDFSCLAGRAVFCRMPEDAARKYLIEESVINGTGDIFQMTLHLREV